MPKLILILLLSLLVPAYGEEEQSYVKKKPKKSPTPPIRSVSIQQERWASAEIRKEKLHYVRSIRAAIQRNRARYYSVAVQTGIPWEVIGALHYRESDLDFTTHLHNGDSLRSRTRHVPRGRPSLGNPPFEWEFSALDAVRFDGLDQKKWDTMEQLLDNVESFNGWGYRAREVPSPYLYSMTTAYKSGKFIADGKYSPTAIDQQAGVAAIWKVK